VPAVSWHAYNLHVDIDLYDRRRFDDGLCNLENIHEAICPPALRSSAPQSQVDLALVCGHSDGGSPSIPLSQWMPQLPQHSGSPRTFAKVPALYWFKLSHFSRLWPLAIQSNCRLMWLALSERSNRGEFIFFKCFALFGGGVKVDLWLNGRSVRKGKLAKVFSIARNFGNFYASNRFLWNFAGAAFNLVITFWF